MRPVIIESPYSSGTPVSIPEVVARNERYLNACLRDSLLRGEAPYASHGLYTRSGVLDDTVAEERKHGMEAGWRWLEVMYRAGLASGTEGQGLSAVYLDLGMSSGMERGIIKAHALGVEVNERRLGGLWAKCGNPAWGADRSIGIYCKAGDTDGSMTGPKHAHYCPLWRVGPVR
jgi:hypothetical protein